MIYFMYFIYYAKIGIQHEMGTIDQKQIGIKNNKYISVKKDQWSFNNTYHVLDKIWKPQQATGNKSYQLLMWLMWWVKNLFSLKITLAFSDITVHLEGSGFGTKLNLYATAWIFNGTDLVTCDE